MKKKLKENSLKKSKKTSPHLKLMPLTLTISSPSITPALAKSPFSGTCAKSHLSKAHIWMPFLLFGHKNILMNKNKTKFNLAGVPDAFLVFHVDLWEEGVAGLLERTHFFPRN